MPFQSGRKTIFRQLLLYYNHCFTSVILVWFQADSSDLTVPSLPLPDDEGDSINADLSLDDSASVPLVASPDNKDPTDFSDTTEDDVSEGKHELIIITIISVTINKYLCPKVSFFAEI